MIGLSKQQGLDVDPKSIQPINISGNLDRDRDTNVSFFIIEEAKETTLFFSQGTLRVF